MTPSDLERLLQRLEQGVATPEEQERVEAFLREVEEEGLVAEAVRAEAGEIDVTEDVALFTSEEWLSAMLDHELPPEVHREAARRLMADNLGPRMTELASVGHAVREAIAEQGGTVDLWNDVAHALGVAHPEEVPGWDGALLAEAVRAGAGPVDVADEVMKRVRRSALAPAAAVGAPIGANATGRRWFAAFALAAAFVLAVLVGRGVVQGPDTVAAWDVQFASAEEIAITDLSYDQNTEVFVFQGEGENAPLIIWVDDSEEATL